MTTASAALCIVTVVYVTSLTRATDDTSPLQVLYEQQAQRVAQLQAEVNTLQSAVSALKQTVAFTAHYSHQDVNVGDNSQPLVFDVVVTNIGGGYNNRTGDFTAPVSGTYVFLLHITHDADPGHQWVHVMVEAEGRELCRAVANKNVHYERGDCQAAVHLTRGQQAFARRAVGGVNLIGGVYNSLAGFLFSADVD